MNTEPKKETGITLVTGADSDISAALIGLLEGDVVAHFYSSRNTLDRLTTGERAIIPIFGDLSSTDGINDFLEELKRTDCRISRVAHLPSLPAVPARFAKFDAGKFLAELNVQVISAAAVLKYLLPQMAKRGYGRVAFALTAYCIGVPPKYLTGYVSAKYALMGLMKALAAEYAGKGITLNAVAPSMTETKFLSSLPDFEIQANAKANPMGRNATPADIAPILKMLLGDDAPFMTGAIIPVTGGSAFF